MSIWRMFASADISEPCGRSMKVPRFGLITERPTSGQRDGALMSLTKLLPSTLRNRQFRPEPSTKPVDGTTTPSKTPSGSRGETSKSLTTWSSLLFRLESFKPTIQIAVDTTSFVRLEGNSTRPSTLKSFREPSAVGSTASITYTLFTRIENDTLGRFTVTCNTLLPRTFRKIVVAMVSTIESVRYIPRLSLTSGLERFSTNLTLLVFLPSS